MSLLHTLLGIQSARESAAEMKETMGRLGYPSEVDEIPHITDHEILGHLNLYGAMLPRELRMIGSAGVVGTSEAIERLAEAGKIECGADGKWRLVQQ